MTTSHVQEYAADGLALILLIAACFIVGVLVKTKVGQFLHVGVERYILRIAPGYNLIRDVVRQFTDPENLPFSSVVLVPGFNDHTLMAGFITDRHASGIYTVFIPTGPNPTSGFIFHMPAEQVRQTGVKVEDAIRTIISCGAGSAGLFGGMMDSLVAERLQDQSGP